MNITKTTGAKIKLIREQKSIKQTILAKDLSISVQTLSAMENGKSDITLRKLEQISILLNVAIIDVIGDAAYTDPLAERKRELENATMKLLSLYNDFQENHLFEIKSLIQNTNMLDLQFKIIEMLKRNSRKELSQDI